jgi:hypothetical protein
MRTNPLFLLVILVLVLLSVRFAVQTLVSNQCDHGIIKVYYCEITPLIYENSSKSKTNTTTGKTTVKIVKISLKIIGLISTEDVMNL